jgi:hypothetical protein
MKIGMPGPLDHEHDRLQEFQSGMRAVNRFPLFLIPL